MSETGIPGEFSFTHDVAEQKSSFQPGDYDVECVAVAPEWKRKTNEMGELKTNVSKAIEFEIVGTENENGQRRPLTSYLCVAIVSQNKKTGSKYINDRFLNQLLVALNLPKFSLKGTIDQYREQMTKYLDESVLPALVGKKFRVHIELEPDQNWRPRPTLVYFLDPPEVIAARKAAFEARGGKIRGGKTPSNGAVIATAPKEADF